jgi:hypothetical protein
MHKLAAVAANFFRQAHAEEEERSANIAEFGEWMLREQLRAAGIVAETLLRPSQVPRDQLRASFLALLRQNLTRWRDSTA